MKNVSINWNIHEIVSNIYYFNYKIETWLGFDRFSQSFRWLNDSCGMPYHLYKKTANFVVWSDISWDFLIGGGDKNANQAFERKLFKECFFLDHVRIQLLRIQREIVGKPLDIRKNRLERLDLPLLTHIAFTKNAAER